MIALSVVAFLVALIAGAMIIRWARKHAAAYDANLPQRFHLGNVPRIGGVALLSGTVAAWALGYLQTRFWGDGASLSMGGWIGGWLLVMLPAVLGGVIEDMTQRLSVRYRLARR